MIQRFKTEEEDPLGDIDDIDIEMQELSAQPFQFNVPS